MKRSLVLFGVFAALIGQIIAAEAPAWLTDLPQAKELAKKEKKQILMNFTGSEWCGFCIKIRKEVLSTKEFQEYATKNLVLVELDFPNPGSPVDKAQSAQLKRANAALEKEFHVGGYPTFVVLGSDGKETGRQVGYLKGGVAAFTAKIDGFNKGKKADSL